MIKIFLYECKRLVFNKFFFGILFVVLFYGWQVLDNTTIFGVSYTAPFSAWSFGDYLSRMLPLLWIGALFFLTFFTGPKAQRVAALTHATQMSPRRYAMARCSAAFLGTGLLALACLVEAAVFYASYFGWYGWGNLLFVALITLPSPLVFALGSGWLLGQIRPWLVYVWMGAAFVCKVFPLPETFGILNGSFFTQYPLALGTLDPPLSMPAAAILAQCTLLVCGMVLLFYASGKNRFLESSD